MQDEQNNHLPEQITLEIGASRMHNQVADQRSESDSNESMKQTLQDEICTIPMENNREIRIVTKTLQIIKTDKCANTYLNRS